MIDITFTYKQYQAVYHWATERHRGYLDQAVIVGKARKVSMPYAGWNALAHILIDASINRWGKTKKVADDRGGSGLRSATATIHRALAKVQGHPAMRNEMVIGYSGQEFIVWPSHWSEEPSWVPWPTFGYPAYKLVPVFEPDPVVSHGPHTMRFKEGVTVWRPVLYEGDLSEHYGWSTSDESETAGT